MSKSRFSRKTRKEVKEVLKKIVLTVLPIVTAIFLDVFKKEKQPVTTKTKK